MKTILRNAKVMTGVPGEEESSADCVVIEDSNISWIGSESDEQISEAIQSPGSKSIDVEGKRLMPAFFDGHVHLLHFGISLAKINIRQCRNLDEVRKTIQEAAAANPHAANHVI